MSTCPHCKQDLRLGDPQPHRCREGELAALPGSLIEDDDRYDIMPSVREELRTRKRRIFHLLQKLNVVLGLNDEEIAWIHEYGGRTVQSENTQGLRAASDRDQTSTTERHD